MSVTRAKSSFKETTIYEEKVSQRGEHYYHPYYIGRFLGKGGFASCHEITAHNDDTSYAVKVIPKETDPKKKLEAIAKTHEEISIIRAMDHPGIVKYYHHFQDSRNTYVILELCSGGTLSDILKKRKTFTQPEVRYFVVQIIEIMSYIKKKNIIHRDIKLANYLLDENRKLKLGDFGLATENNHALKFNKRICGTPNYIAPEVIGKLPYGFEVDVWSTGVLVFTMLYGCPPFETQSCKETYQKIRTCNYKFQGPNHTVVECSEQAKDFIRRLLCLSVPDRLKIEQFMGHPFICTFKIPKELEISFPNTAPTKLFLKAYGKIKQTKSKKKKRSKNKAAKMLVVEAEAETSQEKEMPPTAKKIRATYRDALKSLPALTELPCEIRGNDEPVVKIEENICKNEEPLPEPDIIIKKEEVLQQPSEIPVTPPTPSTENKNVVQKKEEQEEGDEESSRTKGRKRFQPNNQTVNPQMEQQTKTKAIPQVFKLLPGSGSDTGKPDLQFRPTFALKYKQFSESYHLSMDQREVKIIHWQNCSKQCGIAYVLNNHHIGFVFEDSECMQLSPKDDKIHYIERKEGVAAHRQIKLVDIEKLRLEEGNAHAKAEILLHYHHILRNKFPRKEEEIQYKSIVTYQAIQDFAPPTWVRSYKRGEGVVIFTISNNNNQFYFEDNTFMYFSLTSCLVSYRSDGKLMLHTIPLNVKEIEPNFREKAKLVCNHYSKQLKMRPESIQRWPLAQGVELKEKTFKKKPQS